MGLLLPVALWLAMLRLWTIAGPAIFVLALCVLSEIVLFFPVAGWIYAPIAILISGPLWPEGPTCWRSKRVRLMIATNALILALYLVPWSTRKPFLHDLYSIKPGMTLAEAERIMARYKRGTGWTIPGAGQEVSPAGSIVFRHSDDGLFNADWGVVMIQAGKVIDVRFDPD